MKKLLSLLFLSFLLVGTFTACKSKNVPLPTKTEVSNTIIKEVVHDTVFETKKDSSYYKAWLECQDGKVIISKKSKAEGQKGNYIKPPIVNIKDNILTVDCEAEAQKLFAKWKDIYRTTDTQITHTNIVEVERKLTWWQIFQIWCGRIFLAFTLFAIIKLVIQKNKPI